MQLKYTIVARKWFDRVNGNTYFSAQVIRHRDGARLYLPYQYGYGNQYKQEALRAMAEAKWLPPKYRGKNERGDGNWWSYERENGYPIQSFEEHGRKAEVVKWGTSPVHH